MRPIDADEVIKAIVAERNKIPLTTADRHGIENTWQHGQSMRGGLRKALRCIAETKTLKVKPVVHGRWIFADDGYMRCSECTQKAPVVQPYDDEPTTTATNYCPNCGAIMDLED